MAQLEDLALAYQRQREEQAAANESARKSNIELFTRLFLSLGADAIEVASSSHDAELREARGLAAHRWSKLLDAEQQVKQEEQALAIRAKRRPAQAADKMLADEVIERLNADWEHQAEEARAGLRQLSEQAKHDRAELESYIVKAR